MANLSDLLQGSGVSVVDEQIFTSSGTWTKPTGLLSTDIVEFEMWGGGASGGAINSGGSQIAYGSSGGCYAKIRVPARDIPATAPVEIGAGGVGVNAPSSTTLTFPGNAGGRTSFLGFRVRGGSGTSSAGGAIGGIDSSLLDQPLSPANNDVYLSNLAACVVSSEVSLPTAPPPTSSSKFAGGAGGGIGSGGSLFAPGTSIFGGAGGAALNAFGVASSGTAPGGSGGAVRSNNTNAKSGDGARGEARIRVIRGVY